MFYVLEKVPEKKVSSVIKQCGFTALKKGVDLGTANSLECWAGRAADYKVDPFSFYFFFKILGRHVGNVRFNAY